MIEIEADILRGSCTPVFFVGETIECKIKFKWLSSNKSKIMSKTNRQELEQQQVELKEKDRYIIESQESENSTQNEMNESMFSVFSNHQSQTSSSNSSVASTPVTNNNIFFNKNNLNSSKSFQSFVNHDDEKSSNLHNAGRITFLDLDSNHIIAWSCAQIDCNCYIDESKVILPKDPLRLILYI